MPSRALKQFLIGKEKNNSAMRAPGSRVCCVALIRQSGNENWVSAISIFIILINSTLIRKHFKVLILTTVKSDNKPQIFIPEI